MQSIKSLEGMGSRSHDLGAELGLSLWIVTLSTSEENVAVVVQVTSVEVEVKGFKAKFALNFSTISLNLEG